MSLTALQTATTPNFAYTRLLYTVSGSIYTGQPQFQYVCDVYNRDTNELLKRMTQGVNPGGSAIFDIARIVQGELEADYNWKINTPTEFSSSKQGFEVKLGEQFASSISSSVVVYPDQANYQIYCNQGVIEPNAGAYNWQQVVDSNTLSNMPATMSMQSDDYGTISAYVSSGTTVISQSFYSASASTYVKVDEKNYSLVSGFDDYFWAIPISSSANYWNYVDVSLSGSYGLNNYRYEASNETHREKTRFAFVNKLGAWDYYNNYNPVRQAIEVEREQYTAARVDYSSRLSTYDISRRGRTDYHNSTDDVFTVDTDLLDKENANWLEELIESPEVYIQRNGEFIPIIITDSSYTSNTNQARQKQFKYTINFKPSNQPFGTWIPEYVNCPKQLDTSGCGFIVNTNTPATGITTSSMTISAQLTASLVSDIQEAGFVYSTSSTVPTVDNAFKQEVPGLVYPLTSSVFDLNTGPAFTANSIVYYRGYASSSNPDCDIVYAPVSSDTTLSFDATLQGTISPYLWFDFTDSSSMDLYDTNKIRSIESKGTYAMTLASMSELVYPNSYSAPIWNNEYVTFDGKWNGDISTNKSSHLSSYNAIQGTGSMAGVPILTTDGEFTMLSFYKPKFTYDGTQVGADNRVVTVAAYQAKSGSAANNFIRELEFIQMANHEAALTDSEFFSNTIPPLSASISASVGKFLFEPSLNTDHGVFSYSGSSTEPWMSQVVTYDGSTPELNIYRTPSLKATFTNTLKEIEGLQGSTYLALGSEPDIYTRTGATADMSHFIIYPEVLNDSQVNQLITNFSQSVSFGNELNSIGS